MDRPVLTWEEAIDWLVSQEDQQTLVRLCYYDRPVDAAAERFWHSEEWAAIRAFFPPPPGVALDLGAGNGIASYALARDGWSVKAVEPDSSATVGTAAVRGLAARAALPIEVFECSGEALPLADNSVDIVNARQVLHHARDLPLVCAEVARVMKPGAVMIATREHVITRPADLGHFLAAHPLHHLYGGENAFMLHEYTGAITQAGLILDSVLGPSDSVINLFPTSAAEQKAIIADAMGIDVAEVPAWILRYKDKIDDTPGRLYSFVARKPH